MLLAHVLAQVLCDQVCRVGEPVHFVEGQFSTAELMLQPKVPNVEVPQLAQTCASSNSNCRAGVCMDGGSHLHPKIGEESDEAESLGRSFRESVQCCFSAAQSHSGLSARPRLERVSAKSSDATTRTTAGGLATGPVRVREHVHGLRKLLPAELLDEAWSTFEVSPDAFESRPIALSRPGHSSTAFFASILDVDSVLKSVENVFSICADAGILHSSPESLACQIGEVWEDVDSWWNREDVKLARDLYCSNFAQEVPSPIQFLRNEIKTATCR